MTKSAGLDSTRTACQWPPSSIRGPCGSEVNIRAPKLSASNFYPGPSLSAWQPRWMFSLLNIPLVTRRNPEEMCKYWLGAWLREGLAWSRRGAGNTPRSVGRTEPRSQNYFGKGRPTEMGAAVRWNDLHNQNKKCSQTQPGIQDSLLSGSAVLISPMWSWGGRRTVLIKVEMFTNTFLILSIQPNCTHTNSKTNVLRCISMGFAH